MGITELWRPKKLDAAKPVYTAVHAWIDVLADAVPSRTASRTSSAKHTMGHFIDNISTRGLRSFTQIDPKMLDIAEKHSIDTDGAVALNSACTEQTKLRYGFVHRQIYPCLWSSASMVCGHQQILLETLRVG